MATEKLRLAGVAEVCEILSLSRNSLLRIRKDPPPHYRPFPEPIDDLKCGPIWNRSDIEALKARQDEKYNRVVQVGITDIPYTTGWDMKALWALHKAGLTNTELLELLEKNGWLDYYRAVVRSSRV